jgi:streptogramin lyase
MNGIRTWLLVTLTATAFATLPQIASAVTIQEFSVTQQTPGAITAGPDGNLWFTAVGSGDVVRLSTAGKETGSFSVTDVRNEIPVGIVTGPDGNIWFAGATGDKIGRITPKGVVKEFGLSAGAEPVDIKVGPDGALWFTEFGHNKIGRITTAGAITEFPLATGALPIGIAAGPDGNMWFCESGSNNIGRITSTGAVTEFSVTTQSAEPLILIVGPDNNFWFTEFTGNKIGRMTMTGLVTEFTIPTSAAMPADLVVAPDGNIWFTELGGGKIASITPTGTLSEFAVPTAASGPGGITVGPDGALWFTELNVNKVARVTPAIGAPCTPNAATVCVDDKTGDRRFQIMTSFLSNTGAAQGTAIGLSSVGVTHGGLFWFFSASNPEMLIKVLNGCGVNEQFWLFYAATTNVGFTITVRDTKTGHVKVYSNTLNAAAPPVQDTSFEGCTNGDVRGDASDELASWSQEAQNWIAKTGPADLPPLEDVVNGAVPSCSTHGSTLCISDRFVATVTFNSGTQSGNGTAIDLTSLGVTQGGMFWFFGQDNPEMLIKVLNGCGVNNEYWIFYAATTNVGFNVTVTDIQSGNKKTYSNTIGTAAVPVQDTSALACPH